MTTTTKLTPQQDQALRLLCALHSHDALDRDHAEQILSPFGVPAQLWKHKANTDPNGVWIDGVPAGTVVERIGAFSVAQQLCHALDIEVEGSLGRGTQFRNCIGALVEHFGFDAE